MRKTFLLLLLFGSVLVTATPLQWRTLAPGLEYTKITTFAGLAGKGISVFRFDLKHYQLQLAPTHQQNRITTVADLVNANQAVVGVNGGFFTPEQKPLGLRINQGQIQNPIKNTTWWGIFYTQGEQAAIVAPKQIPSSKNINFAVQSGPRLIINGEVASLKPGIANRTALGITRDNKIILLATNNFPISTADLAAIMQAPESQGGLNCSNALNLDGGSSTQLYAKVNNFSLSVPSFAMVADAVLVVPNSTSSK